jgi:phosphate:Na+ symporter
MLGHEFPVTLLDLAGSIALVLWGVRMVQTGVQRTLGARLRSALGTALRSLAKVFPSGLGVTAVLQTSTATGLMVAGFAAAYPVLKGQGELLPTRLRDNEER